MNPPTNLLEVDEVVNSCFATAMHATRAAASRALGNHSPGELAFHRDMILNIPVYADFIALQKQRQSAVDNRLLKANAMRVSHDYQPGQLVLRKIPNPDKLDQQFQGPYRITKVHTNGNVTVRLKPNVVERINIRWIKPYKQ